MKTLKLLIKTSFFNKNNDFLCFDIIKYIFNGRSNKVLIWYIIKINTFNWVVLHCQWALTSTTFRHVEFYFVTSVYQPLVARCTLHICLLYQY